ncbi:hypothetical protein EJ05DRAFT_501941 [Pseudovirgaria hyperparasitica]|uniref:Uncharacterized protein n=1 Tax=Pseudovirgaria hyperparasitica TaxID=470096 RepID=A0A6A6W1M1_9PEZI|nr:uncharacterized protein EJ05DRAFT_501941 [Pseudovirgaria hyperparasitica]KAF2756435.1 hypothetical protein EJ05DRAFT_501941 [Pseudovirgaria hyperparasitica]
MPLNSSGALLLGLNERQNVHLQSLLLQITIMASNPLTQDSSIADKLLLPDSWDSHLHVIDAGTTILLGITLYLLTIAIGHAISEGRIGNTVHVCIVTASMCGADKSIILDTLSKLKGRSSAVVTIDPRTVADIELDNMHRHSVRRIRINLKIINANPTKQDSPTICTL